MAKQITDKFKFTAYNEYESDGIINCLVSFVPDTTIECKPPFIKGKKDSRWIHFKKNKRPKSQKEFEDHIGMSIQSWE